MIRAGARGVVPIAGLSCPCPSRLALPSCSVYVRPRHSGCVPSCFLPPAPAWSSCQLQVRGKKTKTTVRIEDLPQGAIPLDPQPIEDDGPAYPTVVLQARRNMQKFDNCVLLTRVGGFYELYFEQAEEYGPLLNLKVAQKKTSAGPVPMVLQPAIASYRPHRVSDFSVGWISVLSAGPVLKDPSPGLEPLCRHR